MKYNPDCGDCKKSAPKPVRAWAIFKHGKIVAFNGEASLVVYKTREQAKASVLSHHWRGLGEKAIRVLITPY